MPNNRLKVNSTTVWSEQTAHVKPNFFFFFLCRVCLMALMIYITTPMTVTDVAKGAMYVMWTRARILRWCSSQFSTQWHLLLASWAMECCWEFWLRPRRLGVLQTPSSSTWEWQMWCCWWHCPSGLHRLLKLLDGHLVLLSARLLELFLR